MAGPTRLDWVESAVHSRWGYMVGKQDCSAAAGLGPLRPFSRVSSHGAVSSGQAKKRNADFEG